MKYVYSKVIGISALTMGLMLVMVSPVYASHCTGAARGLSFRCPAAPGEIVCGSGPIFTCYSGAPVNETALAAQNREFNCTSCAPSCEDGRFNCNANPDCEQVGSRRNNGCDTTDGRGGTFSDDCGTVCNATPRPSVTLAPNTGVQADDQANPSIWINKTGTGRLLQFQGGGTDRVIFTNGGQIILGLSSVNDPATPANDPWTLITQTVAADENLIYGGITATSAGNVLFFERAGTPTNLTLLQLDGLGNLTIGSQLRLANLAGPPAAPANPPLTGALYYDTAGADIGVRVYDGTAWTAVGDGVGIATSGTTTADFLPRFAAGAPLTLTNSLISEANGTLTVSSGGLTVTGNLTVRDGYLELSPLSGEPPNPLIGALYYDISGTVPEGLRAYTAADRWEAVGGDLPAVLNRGADARAFTGAVQLGGALSVAGCFGPVFEGADTGVATNGGVGGYNAANDRCASYGAGAHVCSTAEILESIRCGVRTDQLNPSLIFTQSEAAWISNGPPGFTANANDCIGWTEGSGVDVGGQPTYGAVWNFSSTGGRGVLSQCNQILRFACCR